MTLDLDPDRTLALAYVPASQRSAVEALWRLDVALAGVLATGREPMIGRIRLAWWRESLEKLDRAPPPAEPVLEAVARRVLPLGVTGAEVAEMEQGWAQILPSEPVTADSLDAYAANRGGRLFRYSARLLGGPEEAAGKGGEAWALVDLARHSGNREEAQQALAAARRLPVVPNWPTPLRPLGMLAMLARRDAAREAWEPQGSPGRMMRMLRHRLTGR